MLDRAVDRPAGQRLDRDVPQPRDMGGVGRHPLLRQPRRRAEAGDQSRRDGAGAHAVLLPAAEQQAAAGARPSRTHKAPIPFGPWILWALIAIRSGPSGIAIRP